MWVTYKLTKTKIRWKPCHYLFDMFNTLDQNHLNVRCFSWKNTFYSTRNHRPICLGKQRCQNCLSVRQCSCSFAGNPNFQKNDHTWTTMYLLCQTSLLACRNLQVGYYKIPHELLPYKILQTFIDIVFMHNSSVTSFNKACTGLQRFQINYAFSSWTHVFTHTSRSMCFFKTISQVSVPTSFLNSVTFHLDAQTTKE